MNPPSVPPPPEHVRSIIAPAPTPNKIGTEKAEYRVAAEIDHAAAQVEPVAIYLRSWLIVLRRVDASPPGKVFTAAPGSRARMESMTPGNSML